ncbi:MAG: carbamate kinase [Halobacteriaceae archaeon]
MTRTVVALGGNAILERGEGTVEEMRGAVRTAAEHVAGVSRRGREVVLTHGNGPQVGNLLRQQELAGEARRPLDVLVAETQAQIGYVLQQELDAVLPERVATLVTQTLVDADDPAFGDPTKPVGPFYDESERSALPFETREVTTSEGEPAYRRFVASPTPIEVVESELVGTMVDAGATVVAAGGGGVPVSESGGRLEGQEAVVDKDRTAAVLGADVDAAELLVLTDVEYAYLDFGGPDQRPLEAVTPAELREHLDAGEFGTGSMAPKVEACLSFVEGGGERALITTPENAEAALDGEAGTRVRQGN